MKKKQIGDKIYNVVTMEEYNSAPELYNPKFTAIECGDSILPIIQNNDSTAYGIYGVGPNSLCGYISLPKNEEELRAYSNENVIDYSNAKSIADIFRNNRMLRDIQSEIITDEENILNLKINDDDTPEMKALKQAINMKQADKTQYEDRFSQYQNDMRLLTKGKSITLSKLISFCDIFDIEASITLRDKDGAPNPMNDEINIELNRGGE